jgi:hypothetical protein
MRLFSFYPQISDVGETHSLVPATVSSTSFQLLPTLQMQRSKETKFSGNRPAQFRVVKVAQQ